MFSHFTTHHHRRIWHLCGLCLLLVNDMSRDQNIKLAREYLIANGTATPDQVQGYFIAHDNHVSKQSVNSSLNQLVERGEATKHSTGTAQYGKRQYYYQATDLIGTLPKFFRKVTRDPIATSTDTPEGVLMLQSILAKMRGYPSTSLTQ